MNRLIISLMVGAIFVVPVFANGNNEQAETLPFDPDKNYEISIGLYGELESAYRQALTSEEFVERYPNITVSFTTSDFSGHHSRLITTIAAGEATNEIEALEIANVAKFVEGGGLTDLAAEPFNGLEHGTELIDFAMGNATTSDGRLVAYPVDIAPAVLFYRKSIADAAGVDMENLSSWDEFIEAGQELTADTDGDGVVDHYALPHAADVGNVPLNGGMAGWFNEDGEPLQPKGKFMTALELVQEVRAAGIDADLGAWSGAWFDGFKRGLVASTINGAWFGATLRDWNEPEARGEHPDVSGDWRVTYIPGKTYASMGGTYLSIPEAVPAEQRAAAFEVIKFLTTTEVAQKISFEEADAFPVLTTIYNDPIMDESIEFFGGQKVRQIYADVARNMPVEEVTEFDSAARAMFGNAMTQVLVEGLSPEEAYENALNEIIALTQ